MTAEPVKQWRRSSLRAAKRLRIGVAIGLFVLASGAQAERIRVQVGGMTIYTSTAEDQVPQFQAAAGFAPPPNVLPMDGVVPGQTSPAVPDGFQPAALPTTGALGPGSTSQLDLGTILEHDPGPPSAAFQARMADIYGMTAAEEVAGVWFWHTLEPEEMNLATRSGNAIHRWLSGFAEGEVWGSEYRGPPRTTGTRGALVSVNGVSVRTEPFGTRTGLFPPGAALEVLDRSDSDWYLVRGPGVTGWISGYWLRF